MTSETTSEITNSEITAGVSSIADIILRSQFATPRHQRPYAWEPHHIRWLLDDIANGIKANKSYHYLGPIMLIATDNDDELDINDGQQRLVTLTLICACLWKHFIDEKNDYAKCAMRILFDLLPDDLPLDYEEMMNTADKQVPRITLSTNDHLTYKSLISHREPHEYNKPLNTAWETINAFFAETDHSSEDFKVSFFQFIRSKLQVSWTELKNKNDAVTSFVTQNARGKSLEQVQLACSHFLRCLDNEEERGKTMSKYFEHIRAAFKTESKFFDYVRCFAQCKYGYLPSNNFYSHISKKIDDADQAYNFVSELSSDAKIIIFNNIDKKTRSPDYYTQIIDHGSQKKSRRKITDHLDDLGKYKSVSTCVLFALLCQYFDNPKLTKESEKKITARFICQSSKLLASFFQRATHSFPGSFAPSKYEEKVAQLAYDITDGTCRKPRNFFTALKTFNNSDNIISDAQYKERMKSISFAPRSKTAKHLLIAINEHMEIAPLSVILNRVTVEHILPESPIYRPHWNFSEAEHEVYRYRLGNLTLIPHHAITKTEKFNSSFTKKQNFYATSPHIITTKLSAVQGWNVASINDRQLEFINQALEIWDLKKP